jgi:hypothetical protein
MAKHVLDSVTVENPGPEPREKNPAAVALGRLGGLVGGKARAKGMTAKQRSKSARKAAKARWGTVRKSS